MCGVGDVEVDMKLSNWCARQRQGQICHQHIPRANVGRNAASPEAQFSKSSSRSFAA